MTALSEYQRLEASGLWRASRDAQRCDVIVSVGDATLVITDLQDRALAHWSLAAIERANPGRTPAIYHPDGDPGETLELAESEEQMILAIEKLRSAIDRKRPHPGRLRLVSLLLAAMALIALAVFWLPGAVRDHALAVVPEVKRSEIGEALFARIQSVTGPPCRSSGGPRALGRLSERLPAAGHDGRLIVVRDGVEDTVHLPGGTILINRALVEDHEEPDIVAGYVIAERLRTRMRDPLDRLLAERGLWSSLKLLTTGQLSTAALQAHAEHILKQAPAPLSDAALLRGFAEWSVRSTPYAYARDISGESTIALIEADPFAATAPAPVLSDADWLRLQAICED
ncbi:hypothetical protein DQW77_04670 [Roseovarius sp. TE539]|uniref:hypothetical protein n=1 Tax=Roseovarius sp. TE539 TaxID=2249812 RepID=UPI000DDD3F1E|nr:hypothetical protein [Roseovarius sp. TE539]RBI75667.1 hypothetical protein DQW77_04670 [Roseovarius sp. TE539]